MTRHSKPLAFALAAVFCVSIVPAALAQQTAGNVGGRIVDQQNSAVPGATVNATNTQTGFTRSAVSDAEGLYRLSALPVGTYDLEIVLQGFTTMQRKGIIVNVGQTIDVDFTLQVAQVAESVNVTGASPLVDVSS
jgi:hypothetical protein